MTITCDQALAMFRNMVNQKHPPEMGAGQNRVRRHVNKACSGRGGRGSCEGHGRGGRGGRQRGRCDRGTPFQTRTDSCNITLTHGQQIEYQASFNFPQHFFLKMKPEHKGTHRQERHQHYNERRRNSSEIQELRSQVHELCGTAATTAFSPTDTALV